MVCPIFRGGVVVNFFRKNIKKKREITRGQGDKVRRGEAREGEGESAKRV